MKLGIFPIFPDGGFSYHLRAVIAYDKHKQRAEEMDSRLQETLTTYETMRNELECARAKEESLLADLAKLEQKLISQEAVYRNSLEALRTEKDALEEQRQRLTLERQQLQKEVESLRLEMRLRDQAESASPQQPQPEDKRLETILEPEELSALMAPLDEEDQTADADSSAAPAAEQTLAETSEPEKPAFSLADLIMSEHRRQVSSRRQRVSPAVGQPHERGIRQVVEQYIKPAATAAPPTPAFAGTHSARMWEDDFLTPFQRDLLKEIVQKDIEFLGQTSRFSNQS